MLFCMAPITRFVRCRAFQQCILSAAKRRRYSTAQATLKRLARLRAKKARSIYKQAAFVEYNEAYLRLPTRAVGPQPLKLPANFSIDCLAGQLVGP
jgi:hypothetical protein